MTSSQIISLARTKILERTDDLVDDATLYAYLNLTNQDIRKRAFPNNLVATATVNFTNGEGALPSDFGTLYTDAYDDQNNMFPEISISQFIRDEFSQVVTVESETLKVKPTDTTTLNIKYYPKEETLSTGVDPSIDSYLHEPLVYGVISRALEDLQDIESSVYFSTKYENLLTARLGHLSNYEEDSQRGGTMFNVIKII